MDDLQTALRSIDTQGHSLPRELAGDVVRPQIDFHEALAVHLAHDMLAIDPGEPGISIDDIGHPW